MTNSVYMDHLSCLSLKATSNDTLSCSVEGKVSIVCKWLNVMDHLDTNSLVNISLLGGNMQTNYRNCNNPNHN